MSGVTLDAGGLIALDRDDRRVVVLLARARETGATVTVPASALAASGTSDIADAHVVICARRADQPVVTSHPGDLSKLDPALTLVVV
jgi:hypothetical protein